jgi:hypothetical protein
MLINRLFTFQEIHTRNSFGTSPVKSSVTSKILIGLTAVAFSACALEDGLTGFESSNGKKSAGQMAAAPAPAQFDFSKECGLTPAQLEDKTAVLVSGNYTSFPIIVEGTSMGTAFTVITQAKITISSTSSAKNQNINVSLLGSASGATGIIGLIATPIVKSKAQKASSAASGTSAGTGLPKKDWLKLTNGSNPQFANLLCAAGQTQTITRNLGGGSSTVTFAPTLIDGVSPLAPIARMRLEFGSGKSFTVTATIQGGATVSGTVTVKEVAPTLAYKDSQVKADIAYEFINDFPGGAHTVGLPRRQVLFIDVTKKQIVAIINEDDTIDQNTNKVRPAAVLVRDP